MLYAVAFRKRRITITRKKVLCTKGVSYPGTLLSELIGKAFKLYAYLLVRSSSQNISCGEFHLLSPLYHLLSFCIAMEQIKSPTLPNIQIRSTGKLAVSSSFGQ